MSDESLLIDVRLPVGPGNGSDNARHALETPSQGGDPRTGISQATRAYADEKRASMEDAVCGGIGTKEVWTSSGAGGNVGPDDDLRGAGT